MSTAWKTGSTFNSTFGEHMYNTFTKSNVIPVTNGMNNQ